MAQHIDFILANINDYLGLIIQVNIFLFKKSIQIDVLSVRRYSIGA